MANSSQQFVGKQNTEAVYLEWVDSQGCTTSWRDISDYEADIPIMKSIGWIIKETESFIAICGNIAEETISTVYQGNGIMCIPKKCILKRSELLV